MKIYPIVPKLRLHNYSKLKFSVRHLAIIENISEEEIHSALEKYFQICHF